LGVELLQCAIKFVVSAHLHSVREKNSISTIELASAALLNKYMQNDMFVSGGWPIAVHDCFIQNLIAAHGAPDLSKRLAS
jgi:hypothetical protein